MPEPAFNTPGVTLEATIQSLDSALETGIPVFIGLVDPGSAGRPLRDELVGGRRVVEVDTSLWSKLEARAGMEWGGGYLGAAVRGFFDNGGRRCYVVIPTPKPDKPEPNRGSGTDRLSQGRNDHELA